MSREESGTGTDDVFAREDFPLLKNLSEERVGEEFDRLLKGRNPRTPSPLAGNHADCPVGMVVYDATTDEIQYVEGAPSDLDEELILYRASTELSVPNNFTAERYTQRLVARHDVSNTLFWHLEDSSGYTPRQEMKEKIREGYAASRLEVVVETLLDDGGYPEDGVMESGFRKDLHTYLLPGARLYIRNRIGDLSGDESVVTVLASENQGWVKRLERN